MNGDGSQTQVLIVGAGPSGLVLALYLARLGVRFRIIDKAAEAGSTSRALVVHARTLEYYRQLDVAQRVISAAQKFVAVNLWVGGKRRARLQFGDIGASMSRYPYSLIFPQDEHERVLIEALRERGVEVQRGFELIELAARDDAMLCTIRRADGSIEQCRAAYVAGCDGAHSTVREKMSVALPGGTYSHVWYVADVDVSSSAAADEVHISMDSRDVLAVFPMKDGAARLVGQAPPKAAGEAVTWNDVDARLVNELRTQVRDVKWFSTYRVHHRVAAQFRKGRAFLVGDAAHLHSPVGGQGMNTGIGDAANLAWKLAAALRGELRADLLDSYEPERMTFARGLVATTDRVFGTLNSKSIAAALFRTVVAPAILPVLMRLPGARRLAFRILSQTAINYRRSPLSEGKAGRICAGDRLPWTRVADDVHEYDDNFAPLNGICWQVHVYGEADTALVRACESHTIPLYAFRWQSPMRSCGLVKDAVYLIRPDGHIGLAAERDGAHALEQYLKS